MMLRQTRLLLSAAYKRGYGELHKLPVEDVREFFKTKNLVSLQTEVNIEDAIASNGGLSVPIRIYSPINKIHSQMPILCHLHGGGFVVGEISDADVYCSNIASNSGYVVISIGYRLAPEHKFPAALNDAKCVIKWLLALKGQPSWDYSKIVVSGESSGANLAANLSNIFGEKFISGQILICPSLDYYSSYKSKESFQSGYFLDRTFRDWLTSHYLQNDEQRNNPLVSPALNKDLALIPSSLIICSEFDPMRDEAIAYAERLGRVSSSVSLKVFKGVAHGFINYPQLFECTDDAYNIIMSNLNNIANNASFSN